MKIVAFVSTLNEQVPLSDEAVAVRVAELVDGMVKQLLAVWDKLEPAALGGDVDGVGLGSEIGMMATAAGSLSVTPASIQLLSPDSNSGESGGYRIGGGRRSGHPRDEGKSAGVGKPVFFFTVDTLAVP